jgi:hypothetical protein
LLKTSALGNTPMSASRRSLSSASTAATILQVSQRTDETPGRHADFLRGSGRLASTSARSNPNLYQEDIPMDSAATLSRRESARSSSMLPPPPPYVHDSRVSLLFFSKTILLFIGEVRGKTSTTHVLISNHTKRHDSCCANCLKTLAKTST